MVSFLSSCAPVRFVSYSVLVSVSVDHLLVSALPVLASLVVGRRFSTLPVLVYLVVDRRLPTLPVVAFLAVGCRLSTVVLVVSC